MVSKGARNIVIVSRSDKVTDKVSELMQQAKTCGANIVLRSCDVSDSQSVETMVRETTAQLPPLRGVIHSAMVLDVSSLVEESQPLHIQFSDKNLGCIV